MLLGFFLSPKKLRLTIVNASTTRGDMINSCRMALVLLVANVIGADDYHCTSQKPTGAGDTWIEREREDEQEALFASQCKTSRAEQRFWRILHVVGSMDSKGGEAEGSPMVV